VPGAGTPVARELELAGHGLDPANGQGSTAHRCRPRPDPAHSMPSSLSSPSPRALLPCVWAVLACLWAVRARSEEDAARALLARFERSDIVLLGESPHQGRTIHAFHVRLLHDPDFARRVDDVMVEFGNARHQAIMDRYVLDLEDVPRAELARTWRDTTQLLVWDSPVYEAFFREVRELNEGLPREERVRVLLGDPPIDWAAVRTAGELEPWLDRESSYVEVLEREVLAKDRRALVLIGSSHCMKRTPSEDFVEQPSDRSWLGHLLAARHPGKSFSVYSVFEPPSSFEGTGAELGDGRVPLWIDLATHPLGELSFGLVGPRLSVQREVDGRTVWVPLTPEGWPAMRVMADALLYLGPDEADEEVPAEAATYADTVYVDELRRRAKLLDALFQFDYYVPSLRELLGEED